MKFSFLRFWSLITIIFSFHGFALSQDENGQDNGNPVISPSPTAAALGKYGDIPTNNYLGIPSISVPLYNLSDRGLNLPISLSYHAGGVKVDDIASWVGLGWSLNAGGVITRTVVGLPDERNYGFGRYKDNPVLQNFDGNLDYIEFATQVKLMAEGDLDSQPDIYHFNIGGYSGKFLFDQDGEAHIIPHQNINIDRTLGTDEEITSFTLTTPDGSKFIFGPEGREITYDESTCGGDGDVTDAITAWYLTEQKSRSTSETLTFEYEGHYSNYVVQGSETKYFKNKLAGECNAAPPNQAPCPIINATTGKHLRFVKSKNYIVEFISSEGREDILGGVKLDSISITSKTGVEIRSFSLGYDYYETGTSAASPVLKKRLKLRSVIENNCDKPPHVFTYADDGSSFLNLPPRLSLARDHWGYFNGAPNTTLIPKVDIEGQRFDNAADRRTNPLKVQAGILTEIKYPTGGTTKFTYEANRINDLVKEYLPDSELNSYTIITEAKSVNGLPVTGPTRVLNFTEGDWIRFNLTSSTSGGNGEDLITLLQIKKDGQPYTCADIDPLRCSGNHNYEVFLDPGDYEFTTYAEGPGAEIRLELTYSVIKPEVLENFTGSPVGGLRIKEVNSEGVIKQYAYGSFSAPDSLNSSGRLVRQPKYGFQYFEYRPKSGCDASCQNSCPAPTTCVFNAIRSAPVIPLGSTQGSHISYENVTVLNGEEGAGGKSEFTYSMADDIGGSMVPASPPTSMDWKRGHLLKEVNYKKTGHGFAPIRSLINTYDFRENEEINNSRTWGIVIGRQIIGRTCWPDIHPNVIYDIFAHNTYRIFSQWYYLSSTEEMLDGVTTTTNYEYSPDHLNTISQTMTNSDGKTHRTEYQYAHEKIGDSRHLQAQEMVDMNMTSIPLETRKYVNGALQGGNITTYSLYYNGGGNMDDLMLPNKQYQILHNQPNSPLLRGTILYYTSTGGDGVLGLPRSYERNFFPAPQIFTYFTEGEKEGLLKSQTYQQRTTSYDYYTDQRYRQVKIATGIDGISTLYDYDNCQRLTLSAARNGQLINTYSYHYTLANDPTKPNHIIHTNEDGITNFQYMDGLGRALQTVSQSYTPDYKDLVSGAVKYDFAGRPYKQYLPYESQNNDGSYVEIPEEHDYNEALFENSPLNREEGMIYAGFGSMDITYGAGGSDVTHCHSYGGSSLYRKDVSNGNGSVTTTFTDKIGQLILTRNYLEGNVHVNTYNCYDDRGNLTDVLPPESQALEDIFSYHYVYDNRNRLRTKTLPNGITTEYRYNNLDLLNRQTDANGNLLTFVYNEYQEKKDTYLTGPGVPGTKGVESNKIDPVNGRLLESTTKRLDAYTNIKTKYTYDGLGRLSTAQGIDHTGNQRLTGFAYDGATDRQVGIYNQGGGQTWYERFGFDHGKRLKSNAFNGQTTAVNDYNYRDELIEKHMGHIDPTRALQSVDYQYNIRGFLTHINTIIPDQDDFTINHCEPPYYVGGSCESAANISLEELMRIRFTGDDLNVNCYSECEEPEPIKVCDYEVEWPANAIRVNGIFIEGNKIDLPQSEYKPTYDANYVPIDYPNLKEDLENWLLENNYKFSQVELSITCQETRNCTAKLTIQQTDLPDPSLDIFLDGGENPVIDFTKTDCTEQVPGLTEIEVCDQEVQWNAYHRVTGLMVDGKAIDLPEANYFPKYQGGLIIDYPGLKADIRDWLTSNNYQFSEILLSVNCKDKECIANLAIKQTNLPLSILQSAQDGQPQTDNKFTSINCIKQETILTEINTVIKNTAENAENAGTVETKDSITLFQVELSSGDRIILTEEEMINLDKSLKILGCQVVNFPGRSVIIRADGVNKDVPLDNILAGNRTYELWFDKICKIPQAPTCQFTHFTEAKAISWHIFKDGQLPNYQYYDDRTKTDSDGLIEISGTNSKVNRSYTGTGEFMIDLGVRPDMVEGRQAISTTFTFNFSANGTSPAEIGLHDGTEFIKINGGQTRITLCSLPYKCSNTITLTVDNLLTTEQLLNLQAVGFMSGALEIHSNELSLELTGPCEPENCQRPTPICDAEEARRQKEYIEELRRLDPSFVMLNMPMPNTLHRAILCNGSEIYLWEHELQLLYGGYEILQSIEVDQSDFVFTVFQDGEDSADAFAMHLHYAEAVEGFQNGEGAPQLSGNIGSIDWQGRGRQTQRYGFSYDRLDRLTSAAYLDRQPNGSFGGDNKYGVPQITYDLNGNIKTLHRRGPIGNCDTEILYGNMDVLDYKQYKGNQLEVLEDQAAGYYQEVGGVKAPESRYAYDANGNLISDSGKGITEIQYNFLNLPRSIEFGGGNKIEYVYDATGAKLRKIVTTEGTITETRDYVGGVELVDNNLEAIYHSEGRMGPNGMEYTITDHLGNARVSFADLNNDGRITVGGAQSEILQENHYYPFGLKMDVKGAPQIGKENKRQFNGKEISTEFGLNWNDHGARFYDPAIGRWGQVDPLAEQYLAWSTYNFVANNPLNLIDPNGMAIEAVEGGVKFTGKDAKQLFKSISNKTSISAIHFVFEEYTPTIYKNTLSDFKKGQPSTLTYDSNKDNKKARRKQAIGDLPSRYKEGLERDEYPYASTTQGGAGASVHYVPKRENSTQGGQLSALYSQIESGDNFLVLPVPEGKTDDPKIPKSAKAVSSVNSKTRRMKLHTGLRRTVKGGKRVGLRILERAASKIPIIFYKDPNFFPVDNGPDS